jgi:hypothetical protein
LGTRVPAGADGPDARGFAAFADELAAGYPPAFAHLAWQLYRLTRGDSPVGPLRARQRAFAPFTLEYLFAAPRPPLPEDRRADVLVTFFPARPDYAGLLAPVAAELTRRGVAVGTLLPTESADPGLPGPALRLGSYAGPRAYAAARARWAVLTGHARRFAARHGLDAEGRAALALLLHNYAWQEATSRAALEDVRPRVVLGLHFMTDPGLRAGVETTRARPRPRVVLLQHGLFSGEWPTHDFHGADLVMLWGEASREELARFPDPPAAVVVGNPRLAGAGRVGPATVDDAPVVLVAGTNGDPEVSRRALSTALGALRELPGVRVRVRPHPREPRSVYEGARADGLLTDDMLDASPDPYDAVRGASVVVGTFSTLLPEAIALGVPAVQVVEDGADLWWTGGMAAAASPADLRAVVARLVSDEAYRADVLAREAPTARAAFGEPARAASLAADAVLDEMERG